MPPSPTARPAAKPKKARLGALHERIDAIVTGAVAVGSAALAIVVMMAGFAPATGALVALGAYVTASQLHAWSIRARQREAQETEILFLKRSLILATEEMEVFKEKTEAAFEKAAREQAALVRELAAENRMTETLLRQFADATAARVRGLEQAAATQEQETKRIQTRLNGGVPYEKEKAAPDRPDTVMLDAIQKALIENRVDLHLQPIVSLPQRRLKFYEALTRLRDTAGAIIMPSQYLRVAGGAGLMPTIDNLLLFRCVQFIRRLAEKNREIGVFCNISPHSLKDQAFFPQFLDFLRAHRDLAGQIVFETGQEIFDRAPPAVDTNLRFLAELGFPLSVDRVQRLDIDPEQYAKRGVRFLKVKASVLAGAGSQIAGGIRPEDCREYFARWGLTLIAEKIESEREAIDALDYGPDLGQGHLFGAPRPAEEIHAQIRDKPQAAPAAAAAPAAPAPPPLPRQAQGLAQLMEAQRARRELRKAG
jgi:cyclic-di-GMP phosphodiesterase TipF (flagellum assembly factor)